MDSLHEGLVEGVWIFWAFQFGIYGSNTVKEGVLLIALPQIGDLTRVEHVVNVLEEGLIHDLRVGKQEGLLHLIDGAGLHHGLDEFVELLSSIVFGDLDGLGCVPQHVGRQSGQGLLT